MNKMFSTKSAINFLLISGVSLALQSCGLFGGGRSDDQGNLVGVHGREGWEMTLPYGMVPIPAGTFHMGQADEDLAATQINFNKQITIAVSIWMTLRSPTMSIVSS